MPEFDAFANMQQILVSNRLFQTKKFINKSIHFKTIDFSGLLTNNEIDRFDGQTNTKMNNNKYM